MDLFYRIESAYSSTERVQRRGSGARRSADGVTDRDETSPGARPVPAQPEPTTGPESAHFT
jgi:hypothetical protein